MRLLDKLDAAGGSILLHSLDQHLGLLCCILESFLVFLVDEVGPSWQALVIFLLRIFALSYGPSLHDRDFFLNCHIQRRLPILVQHEEMVGKVGKLRLEGEPIWLEPHQLVHRGVAIRVHPIVVWVDQVTLNVVESLHLDATQLDLACSGSHGRVFGSIDKLADDEDCHD